MLGEEERALADHLAECLKSACEKIAAFARMESPEHVGEWLGVYRWESVTNGRRGEQAHRRAGRAMTMCEVATGAILGYLAAKLIRFPWEARLDRQTRRYLDDVDARHDRARRTLDEFLADCEQFGCHDPEQDN